MKRKMLTREGSTSMWFLPKELYKLLCALGVGCTCHGMLDMLVTQSQTASLTADSRGMPTGPPQQHSLAVL